MLSIIGAAVAVAPRPDSPPPSSSALLPHASHSPLFISPLALPRRPILRPRPPPPLTFPRAVAAVPLPPRQIESGRGGTADAPATSPPRPTAGPQCAHRQPPMASKGTQGRPNRQTMKPTKSPGVAPDRPPRLHPRSLKPLAHDPGTVAGLGERALDTHTAAFSSKVGLAGRSADEAPAPMAAATPPAQLQRATERYVATPGGTRAPGSR